MDRLTSRGIAAQRLLFSPSSIKTCVFNEPDSRVNVFLSIFLILIYMCVCVYVGLEINVAEEIVSRGDGCI